ncbi:MAG: OB-fold nucleic acid binding domain-containing protein, partial [Thiohalobacteraceae bacterium]
EKFAGYGFNKSHSAAYALVSYQTAWMKAHYPAAFMAAVLSADMDNTDKIVTLIDECRSMKLKVVPPDINRSHYRFTVAGDDTVIYGLGAIKGVGQAAIEGVVAERAANGRFEDLYGFCRRIDLRRLNRRVLEALVRAGACDSLGENRASLMAQLPTALKFAEQQERDQGTGQVDLFGAAIQAEVVPVELIKLPEWDEELRLQGEKDTLGLYLTGHPIVRYEAELARITSGRLATLIGAAGDAATTRGVDRQVVVAGLVIGLRVRQTRRGSMAFVTLVDRSARVEMRVFSDVFDHHRNLIAKDKVLVIEGVLGYDDYSGGQQLTADKLYDISQAREIFARRVVIDVDAQRAGNGFVQSLVETLSPFRAGKCPVWISYRNQAATAQLALGREWNVRPADELIHRLHELAGEGHVQVEYR